MQFILFVLAAFSMGIITTVYLPMNSSVAKYVGSPIVANVAFFLVALLTTLVALSATLWLAPNIEGLQTVQKLRTVPTYLYLGGACSALFILGTTVLIPRLGANIFFVLFVSGQVVMAVIISHFGLLESPKDPISLQKIIGIMLLIAGITTTTISAPQEFSQILAIVRDFKTNLWGT